MLKQIKKAVKYVLDNEFQLNRLMSRSDRHCTPLFYVDIAYFCVGLYADYLCVPYIVMTGSALFASLV